MPFVDTRKIDVIERRPGWRGRTFHSPSMTFVHYEFDEGADVHRHSHSQEEIWQVLDGELEVTVGEETILAGPGMVAIVPPNVEHAVIARSNGRAIVTDYPLREIE